MMGVRTNAKYRRREKLLPYLLLSPALVLLIGMMYPFGLGLYYSLTSYWLQYPNRFRFVWFDNYVNLVSEPLFSRALQFTLGFTFVAVIVQVGLGLAVALFLHARIPGRNVIRALMLMPFAEQNFLKFAYVSESTLNVLRDMVEELFNVI